MLRARRIDLDQVATAYCWEEKLNLAKRPAVTQLVKELVIYLQELQDQYNDSSKASANEAKPKQTNNLTITAPRKKELIQAAPPNPDRAIATHMLPIASAIWRPSWPRLWIPSRPSKNQPHPQFLLSHPRSSLAAQGLHAARLHPLHRTTRYMWPTAHRRTPVGAQRDASPHMSETVLPTTTTWQDSADSAATEQQQKDKTTPESRA